ncbi:MAG: hypothetical protein IT368_13035 [Candidatus Hydrogenedentes bacterium]|nr:hypothetical protein [Candidatus Hydrogenedentota bacterium]
MIRSAVAIVGGYAVIAVIVILSSWTMMAASPEFREAANAGHVLIGGPLFIIMASSLIAALLGGAVTAAIAARARMVHVLVLAVIVLALAAYSFTRAGSVQPVWYQAFLAAAGPLGVLAGGAVMSWVRREDASA